MTPRLKLSDLMRRWGTSRGTVLQAVNSGQLVAFRLPNGRLRFRPEDVAAYESRRQVQARDEKPRRSRRELDALVEEFGLRTG